MGMDLFGNQPSDQRGNSFSANIWNWAAICHLCATLGGVDTEHWDSNNGHGLETQGECDLVANRLAEILGEWKWGDEPFCPIAVDLYFCIDDQGHFLTREIAESRVAKGEPVLSPFSISREQLAEFVEFCRHCGGFQIW
jgi:hypothetical protein